MHKLSLSEINPALGKPPVVVDRKPTICLLADVEHTGRHVDIGISPKTVACVGWDLAPSLPPCRRAQPHAHLCLVRTVTSSPLRFLLYKRLTA